MKRILLLLVGLCTITLIQAQNDCEGYFAYKQGTDFEITSYGGNGKVENVLQYKVIKNKPISGGMEITFHNKTYDKKNKLLFEGDFIGKCINGSYFADVESIISSAVPQAQAQGMEMSIEGNEMSYPNNLSTGQKLEDTNIQVKAGMNGMTLMNMSITYTDRKVEGFEEVETPAGKFTCAKITYKSSIRGLGSQNLSGVEYAAKDIGIVKSEQYNAKGKKISSTLLTKLKM
ncbi:MAG: hypothetical protein ACFB0B_10205 [Thermonemataceae bacterium]